MRRFALCFCSFFALPFSPVVAEEVVVVSPCQDELSPVTEADMGRYLAGTWSFSAPGTGFTTGTTMMQVTLRFDETAGHLFMEGQGASVRLIPIGLARNIDDDAAPTPEFDASVEAMNPLGMSADEINLTVGGECDRPMRYWWTAAGGQAWGGLMFIENGLGSGFMANSAGGSRDVMISRP